MIVKGLNSQKKLTQQQKQVITYKYVKKNNKKMRPFYNKTDNEHRNRSTTEAQLLKNVKLNNFNTLLTKFTNEVKKAIKQERKLGINVKTQGQTSKSKLSHKKNSLSIKKIKYFTEIQYEKFKKKEHNFKSIRSSMLISKKTIGLNLDKSAKDTLQLIEGKNGKEKSVQKQSQLSQSVLVAVQKQTKKLNNKSFSMEDTNQIEEKKDIEMQKKRDEIRQKQFIPLGKLSQTLPSNYKSYLLQNLSRYKNKDNQEDIDDRLQTINLQLQQKTKENKKNKQTENKNKNKIHNNILQPNGLIMEREYLKSKQLKAQIINKSKSKYRKPRQRQEFHPPKEIFNRHIFNLSFNLGEKQTIKAKKQSIGVGPWGQLYQSSSIDHSPH